MSDFNETMIGENGDKSSKSLVTARGTADGLIIRINADAEGSEISDALREYISARRSFLTGNKVSLDWGDSIPAESMVAMVSDILLTEYNIKIQNVGEKSSELKVSKVSSFAPPRSGSKSSAGLFGGIESLGEGLDSTVDVELEKPVKSKSGSEKAAPVNSMFWDNPDAMIMHATLRSGQKIETEHSLVLVGDVNFGAEIIAGGDVIVLGKLRGVVHAGAYDETGGGRFIFSLDLQPTQLRIGSIISRGSTEATKVQKSSPEIAFVDGAQIVVEPYNSRAAANKMQG